MYVQSLYAGLKKLCVHTLAKWPKAIFSQKERNAAEAAHKGVLQLLYDAEEIGLSGSWSLDRKTGLEIWSKGEFFLHGLSSDVSPSYELHLACVHPEDRDLHDRLCKEHLASDQTDFSQEYRILASDGAIRYIHTRYQITRDDNGRALFVKGIDKDISERKIAEKKHRFQRDLAIEMSRTSSLAETAKTILSTVLGLEGFHSGGIYLLDEKTAGLDLIAHQGLAQSFVDKVKHYDSDDPRVQVVMKGDILYLPVTGYHSPIRKDLETDGIATLAVIPLKYGDAVIGSMNLASYSKESITDYSRSIIESISEIDIGMSLRRVIAEESLRESENRFRTLFEIVPTPVQGYGSDETIHFWNKASELLYGYGKAEAVGKKLTELIIPPDMLELVRGAIRKYFETGEMPPPGEHLLMRKDGRRVPVFSSHAVINQKGKDPEFYCLDVDMTVHNRLQSQLRQAHKMESIGTLAGGIAHDFNNILYMITGNAELALEDIPEWNPVHENIKAIKNAGQRAAGIVKQLLRFSRKTDQELGPIGAITIIRDSIKFLRSTIPATIEIRQHLPDKEIMIFSDPIQVNQILMNICTNAAQAMEEKGGILEIRVESLHLDEDSITAYPDLMGGGVYLMIRISDTGSGIDHRILERIFDPYFSTRGAGKGSGMGLSVVHGIVQSHNGSITVASRPGKGTVFTILLPVITGDADPEHKTLDDLPKGNERILFVDDEESIVNMTKKMLDRLGYLVETETDPVYALQMFASNPDHFDLVITDMTMPQMTGIRLHESLMKIRPDIPVIICTGHSSRINENQIKQMGIAALIMKPILKQDLAVTIRRVLDH